VVANRTSSVGPSTPSCFASKSVAPCSIDHFPPSAAFWNAWICLTWICHYDWQEQISAEVAYAEAPGALELDAMGLDKKSDPMESRKDSDAMESDVGPEVLCHNLLVWALLS
jgi:hypothetical protein